ncbi:uncharacterized protein LOC132544782 [Ylistrum balloti]|uniref:uncharacterized protein LOC132544782 n=1 Tax=Ylistrum balloti TaxID=509963 RepID=UPI002905F7A6|nr:uncharacterized protein LOC132544782 [Ylistrum balloti]
MRRSHDSPMDPPSLHVDISAPNANPSLKNQICAPEHVVWCWVTDLKQKNLVRGQACTMMHYAWSIDSNVFRTTYRNGSQYRISVPEKYVAFMGDLAITYSVPINVSMPNAFIRVLAYTGRGRREITTIKLTVGQSTGSGRVTCGLIEVAGRHLLEMYMYLDGPLLTSKEFTVRWPEFHLYLPKRHLAQTTEVKLHYTSEARCGPLLQQYSFQIDLEYRSVSQFDPSYYNTKPTVLHSEPVLDISRAITNISYTCDKFDFKGSYRAFLRNSYNKNETVARSNVMDVKWSDVYDVRISSSSVHPCQGHLAVLYEHPQCAGSHDKIRMYVLRRDISGSLAAPLKRVYVTERHAHPDKTYVVFKCNLFPMDYTAVGFCFVYVTISKTNLVVEQHSSCVSAHEGAVLPTDGGWSEWGAWSTCSVTCDMGKRSRYRSCSNPAPAYGGQFCDDFPVQFEPCFSLCPDAIPHTPLHSPTYNQECACGCEIKKQRGEIIGTGRCDGLSLWLLTVEDDQNIKLSFQYFKLYEDRQWIKIRDGDSVDANLLAVSFGGIIVTEVTSSSNKMLIEFMSKTDINPNASDVYHSSSKTNSSSASSTRLFQRVPTRKIHVHGFIANFSSIPRNFSTVLTAVPLQTLPSEGSIWKSTVTIVGICLCAVIVMVAVVVAFHHKCVRKREHKYSIAGTMESPNHMAKSTSMHSTPSHHSALSGIEIDYDMERPLTGQSKQKSRASSISSIRSNGRGNSNRKRLRSKSDHDSTGGSPKPPSKHYSPLPSPLIQAAKNEEGDEKNSLFNTSPILGRRPKSPKVHPSSKFKNNRDVKSPLSPPLTKHEMLKRKRFDSEQSQDKTPTNGFMERTRGMDSLTATPLSTGSATPTTKVLCAEVHPVQRESPQFTQLEFLDKPKPEEVRKPGSGTSDDSQSPENLCKEQTTSFINKPDFMRRNPDSSKEKPRRPTSLTESYSMNALPPLNGSDKKSTGSNTSQKIVAPMDRHNDLPKPDGQSPKTPREICSKSSTPKSCRSSRSRLTLSPSRSATTPSDGNLEMEYDDFIDYDDTYSYFDPIETEKLQWRGKEKLSKIVSAEDD